MVARFQAAGGYGNNRSAVVVVGNDCRPANLSAVAGRNIDFKGSRRGFYRRIHGQLGLSAAGGNANLLGITAPAQPDYRRSAGTELGYALAIFQRPEHHITVLAAYPYPFTVGAQGQGVDRTVEGLRKRLVIGRTGGRV